MDKSKFSIESETVHGDHPENDPFGSHVMPIYQTSTFRFNSVEDGRKFFAHEEGGATHSYSRLGNPTVDRLEDIFARLEGTGLPDFEEVSALAFSSGMAAISTALIAIAQGGSIVAQPALYGCTGQFLKEETTELGMKTHFVDLNDLEALEHTLSENGDAKVIYAETIANPTMEVANISAIADLAEAYDLIFIVDNTFATPYHLRPLEHGADMVLHSATKYLNGHGTLIGGALIARQSMLDTYNISTYRKNLGGVMSPFEAWLLLNGLKTFHLRMERHAENAMKVAEYLEEHEAVSKMFYPGLNSHADHDLASNIFEKGYGGILSFELEGGFEAGVQLMDNVKLCTLAVSLGTADTLIQHPASMTHSVMDEELRLQAGITDGLVRLAVGIEDVDDIISDLKQALPESQAVTI
ncbi:aminotransferase class I/II-fold pyridoxal phosphate-dependent enzyme [Fodinibius sp.]|uniref:trans-sulfuration enzyme family protein n=1 Tax=Fodinibius sp. TaxID=1872440 RepID=UPI002ACD354F|nr:aminotransferase class I/II-fold pyridoxal phosphate-dependent enzyme [Fodinibius sp.]MDZ7657827.1 aminotransferase class I/II-fold pyridoxal phosphate-dependent enzyme [Fodinibius sp.]